MRPEAFRFGTSPGNARAPANVSAALAHHALRIARVAGVDLVPLHFTSPKEDARFAMANAWPDVAEPAVADALLEYLTRKLARIQLDRGAVT